MNATAVLQSADPDIVELVSAYVDSRAGELRDTTTTRYRIAVEREIAPRFGGRTLFSLKDGELEGFGAHVIGKSPSVGHRLLDRAIRWYMESAISVHV